jgi:hypothetical protein
MRFTISTSAIFSETSMGVLEIQTVVMATRFTNTPINLLTPRKFQMLC